MKLYKFFALFNCILINQIKTFSENKFCILNTVIGQTEISVLQECSFRQIYCGHNLKQLWPTHEFMVDLCSRTYVKINYPERESIMQNDSNLSFKQLKLGYIPRLLVDQYLEGIPFIFKTKSVDELRKIIQYLKHEFSRYAIIPADIILAILMDYGWEGAQGSILEALDKDDAAFVERYFNVLSPTKVQSIFQVYYKMISQFDSIKSDSTSNLELLAKGQKTALSLWKFVCDMGMGNIVKTFVLLKVLHWLNKIGPEIDLGFVKIKMPHGLDSHLREDPNIGDLAESLSGDPDNAILGGL